MPFAAPASPEAIRDLVASVEYVLPAAYLGFLRRSNGGAFGLGAAPGRALLWRAEELVRLNHEFDVPDSFPGLLGIGSDGGATLIALDARAGEPGPVVAVPFVGVFSELVELAPDFESFAGRLGP